MPKTVWKRGVKAELEMGAIRIMKTGMIEINLLKYFNEMSLIIHAFGGSCYSILGRVPIFEN